MTTVQLALLFHSLLTRRHSSLVSTGLVSPKGETCPLSYVWVRKPGTPLDRIFRLSETKGPLAGYDFAASDGIRLHLWTKDLYTPTASVPYRGEPDFSTVFPRRFSHTYTVEKEALSKVIPQDHEGTVLFLRVKDNDLSAHCLPLNAEPPQDTADISVALNTEYVDVILRACPEGSSLTVKLSGPTSPVLFEAPGIKALLMPLTVK